MSKSKKDKPLSLPPENPNLKLKGSSRTSGGAHFDQCGQKVSTQYNADKITINGNVEGSNIVVGNNNQVVNAESKSVICPKCQHENLWDIKSCVKCGTLLIFVCPICKSETHFSAKFCSGCGKEISLILEQVKKDNEKR